MARDVLKRKRTGGTSGLQIDADGECTFAGRGTGSMLTLITIFSRETYGYYQSIDIG